MRHSIVRLPTRDLNRSQGTRDLHRVLGSATWDVPRARAQPSTVVPLIRPIPRDISLSTVSYAFAMVAQQQMELRQHDVDVKQRVYLTWSSTMYEGGAHIVVSPTRTYVRNNWFLHQVWPFPQHQHVNGLVFPTATPPCEDPVMPSIP